MKLLNITKHIIINFRAKHRLSFRNPHTDTELWYMFISPMNVLMFFLALIIILFLVVMLVVAYTPILDLIPGYPGNKSREILIENVMRLDSLEREIRQWEVYEGNISRIMDGKAPMSVTASATADTLAKSQNDILPRTKEDSIFRAEVIRNAAVQERKGESIRSFELYVPVKGVVIERFDLASGIRGITVSVPSMQPVMAVTDGVVVLNTWTPTDGYVLQLQHGGNMISTYKQMSQIIKQEGDRVKAGEVIGYVGGTASDDEETADSEKKVPFYFELWDSGTVVDPENYMLF
ncbi:MAG TPA: M23 family metallopeptidase [Candidatus Avirikenella pullistercoris]|nr:M23 family metallopeptidase [Candidatus Avirikenella pullistercoris]